MHFRDSHGIIDINNDSDNISIPSAVFTTLETDYAAVSDNAERIWTPHYQCLIIDGNQGGDPFYTWERFETYTGKIEIYRQALPDPDTGQPVLWIHYENTPHGNTILQPDGIPLMRATSDDSLHICATVRDEYDNPVPLMTPFPIRMCYRDGREAFIRLVVPSALGVYEIDLQFENKQPVRYCLFDHDFAPIEINDVIYQFRQVTPLIIDVYER